MDVITNHSVGLIWLKECPPLGYDAVSQGHITIHIQYSLKFSPNPHMGVIATKI